MATRQEVLTALTDAAVAAAKKAAQTQSGGASSASFADAALKLVQAADTARNLIDED